jgi:hypothetical protein
MGGRRKQLNQEVHNLYPSQSIIRMITSRMKWAGHVYTLFVEMPAGKRPLERSRCRWVDDIKMDLGKRERMGWHGLDLDLG